MKIRQSLSLVLSFCLLLSLLQLFAGCGTETPAESTAEPLKTTTVEETEPTSEEEPVPTEPEEPVFLNPLTGLPCDEALVGKRPAAVMLNNLKVALPQSGLSACDIIYEVEAEGGIMRMEGLILDYANAGILGSMRSARPYFAQISLAYDAIFVHAGGSDRGYEFIANRGVDDVDGVKRGPFTVGDVKIFWRDQTRLNQGIALEHTMFTSGENVALAVQFRGYRTELQDPQFTAFRFAEGENVLTGASTAKYIKIPHSNYSVSEFEYHADDGLYYHVEYGEAHVDGQDGKQVATKNVFILFTQQSLYPNQVKTSYRNIVMTGEGKGYYCVGGEVIPIVWKRDSETGPFRYYREDGKELEVTPGKSYVSVANQTIFDHVVFAEQAS